MPAKLPKESIFEFETSDFSDDCEELGRLNKSFIQFDRVKEKHWPSLRSVDAVELDDFNRKVSFIEFCDLKGELADQRKKLTGCKNQEELIIERLFSEFADKAVHSLLILSRYYGIDPECIDYTIVICSKDKNFLHRNIAFITHFKSKLNDRLLSRLNVIIKKPENKQVNFFMFVQSFLKKFQ
ncbi:MAG: hypothetical protein GY749_08950 [Desulfobacteraceae bacterium]|nr:hypothetical protein [Desulfobacteraceae bacterium]